MRDLPDVRQLVMTERSKPVGLTTALREEVKELAEQRQLVITKGNEPGKLIRTVREKRGRM